MVALAFAGPLGAQVSAQELFDRVRAKVVASVSRAPDFTCTETVERFNYLPLGTQGCTAAETPESALRQQSNDRLRLDVGVSSGEEIYSWHGEPSFNRLGIQDLVAYGAIGTGTFFSFLAAIFRDAHGSFRFKGTDSREGHSVAEFSFAIPSAASTWEVRVRTGAKVVVGYQGSFVVDSVTADLLSLRLETIDVPRGLEFCDVRIAVQYHQVRLRSSMFLLPQSVEAVILSPGGARSRDEMEYIDCHEFRGESTIHFDAADISPQASADALMPKSAFPPGLILRVRLTSPIDFASSWVGDPIEGLVDAPVYGRKHQLLAPRGARMTGRLVRLEQFESPSPYTEIGLDWRRIESGQTAYTLAAYRAHASSMPGGVRGDRSASAPFRASGTFILKNRRPRLDAGFVSNWISTSAGGPDGQP